MPNVHAGQMRGLVETLPGGQPVIITAAALQYFINTIGLSTLAIPQVQPNGKTPINLTDLKGF